MSKELRPLTSTLCKQRHQEYVDYIERNVLTKQSEVDTSVIARDTDEFYGKLNILGGQRQETSEGTSNLAVLEEGVHTSGDVSFIVTDGIITTTGTNNTDKTIVVKIGTVYMKEGRTYYFNRIGTIGAMGAYVLHGSQKWFEANVEKEVIATATGEFDIYISTGAGQTPVGPMKLLISETSGAEWIQGKKQIPSLQYPSEIEAVGDNVNIYKLSGKSSKYNNVEYTVDIEDESIVAMGTPTSAGSYKDLDNFTLEVGTYTLSTNKDFIGASNKSRVSLYINSPWTELGHAYGGKNLTFTLTETKTLHLSYIVQNEIVENKKVRIKIEKGSKATSYSKFGQGSVEISTSNKNLFEETFNDKSKIGQFSSIVRGNFFLKENMTYTVSFDTNSNSGQVYINEVLFNTAQRRGCNGKRQSLTATAKKTGNFIDEVIIKTALTTETAYDISNVQIELADTNSDYVEHRGETHIMPIQQKMFEGDAFERIDGVWYEKHDKGEYVLDGVNNKFTYFNDTNHSARIDIEGAIKSGGYYAAQKDNLFLMCTHFKQGNTQAYFQPGMIVYWDNLGQLYVKFEEGSFTGLTQANAWLKEQYEAGTPMMIAYQRTEPLLLKCTEEQSAILDKIDTYKDGTIITTDNDLCKISLRYKQNLEKRISELEKQMIGGN